MHNIAETIMITRHLDLLPSNDGKDDIESVRDASVAPISS